MNTDPEKVTYCKPVIGGGSFVKDLLCLVLCIVFFCITCGPSPQQQASPYTGQVLGPQKNAVSNYYGFTWWQVLIFIAGMVVILWGLRKLRLLDPTKYL